MKTTAPPRSLPAGPEEVLRLVAYPPKAPPETRILARGSLDIGRSPVCGLCLDEPRVSGVHARVRRKNGTSGGFEVVDLESTNGTFLDGALVETDSLEHGQTLRIGDTLLVAEIGPRRLAQDCSRSMAHLALAEDVLQAARATTPVLLLGPSGAGKTWLARQIAAAAGRAEPFVAINCAALPAELVESELFGHEKGAFTGADRAKEGLIAAAHRGTTFLDEIGTIPPGTQAKLLAVLEDQSLRPLGSTRARPVDVLFIAATNLDIERARESGALRDDLYFRLSGRTISLPPLSRRRVDLIPLLCQHAGLSGHDALTPEALESLLIWPWPGNIREALQIAERLKTRRPTPVDFDALPAAMTGFLHTRRRPPVRTNAPPRAELERELARAGGSVSELARRLGKHRNQVVRWLEYRGLRR